MKRSKKTPSNSFKNHCVYYEIDFKVPKYILLNFQTNEVEKEVCDEENPKEPENTQLFVPKKSSRVESPNILELGLVSKSTLQNLGIKLRGEKGAEASSHETNDEIQTDVNDHEALQDDEDIHSPEQEPGKYFILFIFKFIIETNFSKWT